MRKSLMLLVAALTVGIIIVAIRTAAPWKEKTVYEEVQNATEMTVLICERAIPYVTGGRPIRKEETVTFRTVSTVETGGYKVLLCVK